MLRVWWHTIWRIFSEDHRWYTLHGGPGPTVHLCRCGYPLAKRGRNAVELTNKVYNSGGISSSKGKGLRITKKGE